MNPSVTYQLLTSPELLPQGSCFFFLIDFIVCGDIISNFLLLSVLLFLFREIASTYLLMEPNWIVLNCPLNNDWDYYCMSRLTSVPVSRGPMFDLQIVLDPSPLWCQTRTRPPNCFWT